MPLQALSGVSRFHYHITKNHAALSVGLAAGGSVSHVMDHEFEGSNVATDAQIVSALGRLGAQAIGGSEAISPVQLATALGWDESAVRSREIGLGDTRVDTSRGYLGVQPATLFAAPLARNGFDPLESAAFYAYHSAVRWGMFADREGITAFSSHLLENSDWFRFPTVGWGAIPANIRLLRAFTPDNVAEGTIDRLALETGRPLQILQSVDDELVSRLDAWRDEALRYSRSSEGIDENLQNLFAQLFVLRTVEDRALAPDVPPLHELLKLSPSMFTRRLRKIFSRARTHVGSELFHTVPADGIPQEIVSGVIRDLYYPRQLPNREIRYNFSWIDSDVLGLAYEKYLSTILHSLPPRPQLDLFSSAVRDVGRVSVRRASGVYYTPAFLTGYLAAKAIGEFYRRSGPDEIPNVVDFSCGSGSFLVAAMDALLSRLKARNPTLNWARILIEGGHISGIDIDNKAVTVARLNLWQRLTEEPDPLPLPNLSSVVVQGDGLQPETWGRLHRPYDVVLGNPPFVATARVLARPTLESRFASALGRYDYSSLFVEQAIQITRPSGIIALVVPNRLFRNYNAEPIRRLITEEMNILSVVDFGSNEVFSKVSAYIGCLVAEHVGRSGMKAASVRVIDVEQLPPRFVAAALLSAESDIGGLGTAIKSYIAQHPRGPGPWTLMSLEEKAAHVRLEEISIPLDGLAGIYQGIRTGANDIFIVRIRVSDGEFAAEVVNGLGEVGLVEPDLLRPVVYGAELRRYEEIIAQQHLFYPYKGGVLISEAALQREYPLAFRYLANYREVLTERASIVASGLRWYELVRRRDERWLKSPKLAIRDLAPETAFAVNSEGGIFLVGGTSVVPQQEEMLLPLLAYLNTRAMNALVKRTTPQFRGNFQKFEPQHLQRIPVIRRLIEDAWFAERLADMATRILQTVDERARSALEQEIEDLVREAMREQSIAID